jgi:hypothetical protein
MHIKVSYIIHIVFLLHVSATLAAIIREVHYKDGYIYTLQMLVNQCREVTYKV